jgi:hypothetical protein
LLINETKGKLDSTQWNICRLVLIDFATIALHLQYVNINCRVKWKTGKNKLAKYILHHVGAQLCIAGGNINDIISEILPCS